MLLHALEGKRFLPLGADTEVNSRFQLIAGTNRDLGASIAAGGFRENLLACINLWTFELPPLRDRREDIEPNLDYEIEQFASRSSRIVRFTTETRRMYLAFAMSHRARWNGNFRDLSASVSRMATLAPSGRITDDVVGREIQRLESLWGRVPTEAAEPDGSALSGILSADRLANLDRFDRVQLRDVLSVCLECRSLSDAGRELFAASPTHEMATSTPSSSVIARLVHLKVRRRRSPMRAVCRHERSARARRAPILIGFDPLHSTARCPPIRHTASLCLRTGPRCPTTPRQKAQAEAQTQPSR